MTTQAKSIISSILTVPAYIENAVQCVIDSEYNIDVAANLLNIKVATLRNYVYMGRNKYALDCWEPFVKRKTVTRSAKNLKITHKVIKTMKRNNANVLKTADTLNLSEELVLRHWNIANS